MGFKENLKSELVYTGMMVKELSAVTGIKRHTLDNYLNTHNSLPNAAAAVKIAKALGTSVEYLVTGKEQPNVKNESFLLKDQHLLMDTWNRLSKKNQKLAIELLKTLEEYGNR